MIDSFVPLRTRATATPSAALQLEMEAGPIESAVAGQGKRLYVILLAGLALLCAGLLRYVTRSSSHFRAKTKEHEEQALRDPLTGLPNRALFNRIVDRSLADCPPNGMVAVLLMDLDRFKEINDSLGHFNGDLVIERVGKRLATVLRGGDVVARLGGDEFAMLLPDIQTRDSVSGAIKRVQDALEEPFTAGGLALRVEASIGAALYPHDGDTGGNLLRAADVAMYAAKKAHSGHKFYAPEQHQYTPARLGLVAQLSRAMEGHELVLHYQPKARFETGTVEGVEALARWNHPHRGLLYPDEFIPVTEQTSMIRPLTIHLLETALEQVRTWKGRGLDLTVAVNLSAQILLDLDLPKEIGRMLARAGMPASSLEVEITESAIMSDPRRAQKILGRLRDMGVGVAIDDFGTGYSSLVSLKQLPVTTLKIDKSFVMNMESDRDDNAIVRSTVSLGRNMGLHVVAEGVETVGAWNQLKEMGADFAQGYHLSKPLPPDQFDRWLTAYQEMFGAARLGDHPAPVR
jgi:diguanylate cyclase (GGDEF)-like protein